MPTTRTLMRHFVKPFLARNPEFVSKGIVLYLKPVRHVARFILVDRTGGSARSIRWCADALLSFHGFLDIQYGGPLYRSGLWYLDDPTSAPLFTLEAEAKALPSLRALGTLQEFHDFAMKGFDGWPWPHNPSNMCPIHYYRPRYATVLAALGRFEEARKVCSALPEDPWFKNLAARPHHERVLDELYPLLLTEDRPALATLLRSWEEFTIRANKLEDIWEPSPFPFEVAASTDAASEAGVDPARG